MLLLKHCSFKDFQNFHIDLDNNFNIGPYLNCINKDGFTILWSLIIVK